MADEPATLVPEEERIIEFYGDEILAVRHGNLIYVPIRKLCDNLGLNWPGQRQRINRDVVLKEVMRSVGITHTDPISEFTPRTSEMLALPLKFVPGWLFGVNADRVKSEIREKLIRYRREAYDALWAAFKHDILSVLDEEMLPSAQMTLAERALVHAEALYHLARQQVAMERVLAHHGARLATVEDETLRAHERLDKAGVLVGDQGRRLRRIELTLTGGATVTDDQAAAISEAVKALAFELGKKEADKGHDPHDPRGGNPYQRVYSELYRKFRVPSYKALPLESFPAVMKWLTEWWKELTKEALPFAAGDTGGQLSLKADRKKKKKPKLQNH